MTDETTPSIDGPVDGIEQGTNGTEGAAPLPAAWAAAGHTTPVDGESNPEGTSGLPAAWTAAAGNATPVDGELGFEGTSGLPAEWQATLQTPSPESDGMPAAPSEPSAPEPPARSTMTVPSPPAQVQSGSAAAAPTTIVRGKRSGPTLVPRPEPPKDATIITRHLLKSSSKDKHKTEREHKIADGLPEWEPLPPGELVIKRH